MRPDGGFWPPSDPSCLRFLIPLILIQDLETVISAASVTVVEHCGGEMKEAFEFIHP